MREEEKLQEEPTSGWTFLSNHGHVLLCIDREPEIRLRDVAQRVGITERAVQRIVADLEAGRYLKRVRNGRRNVYEVHRDVPMRHPVEAHRDVGALLALALRPGEAPEPISNTARPPASAPMRRAKAPRKPAVTG